MKRIIACSLICMFTLIINAQSIGSFLDFYLGQSISEVRNITNSKYYGVSWSEGGCKIPDVRLAGEQFNSLFISFQNGVIVEATFQYSQFPPSGSYSTVVNNLNNAAEMQKQMISRLYASYKSKYGKETVTTNSSITWRSKNGNSVTISMESSVDDWGMGEYKGYVKTLVTYSHNSYGNY